MEGSSNYSIFMFTPAEAEVALAAIQSGSKPAELESQTLDFKEDGRSLDETLRTLANAAICFANAQGGVIVVGLSDKAAGDAAIKGTRLDAVTVRRRIYELSRPGILVDIEERRLNECPVLLIRVPSGLEVYSDPQGRAPRRVGTDCVPMTPHEQAALREERLGIDWSAHVTDATTEDVPMSVIESAQGLLANLPDQRRAYARLGRRDLLSALGTTTADGRLTRAGDLLFRGGAQVVYQYRATPGGEPRLVERLESPLVSTFQRLMELIAARSNMTAVTLPGGQQIGIADFPALAVREAIVNALVHRDYRLAAPVSIEHSPDVLVISSPGPLVAGVTPANILTHPSRPRNPALAKAVRVLGFAEEVGRGVDRMYREMIRAGRSLPRIEASIDHVRVTLVGGAIDTGIARFVATLPEEEREDTDTLLVLFALCTKRTIDAAQLAPLLQKTEAEAESVLRRLAREEIAMVEPTRGTARRASPAYRLRGEALQALGTAVPYQRRTTDEIDRKIVAHVREYGKVTNRTVQNLFDVAVIRARDILTDLVKRELLVKTSEQQRGPGVEYGPGPKFPSSGSKSRES